NTDDAPHSARGLPTEFRLGHPHRQQPSNPEEDKVEQQKGQEARRRPNALDNEPDEIVGNIAEHHEAYIVEDELHDSSPYKRHRPANVLAQNGADGSVFGGRGRELPSHGVRLPRRRDASATPQTSGWRLLRRRRIP